MEALYRYAIAAGWNLKGAPGPTDAPIGAVFSGASGASIKVGPIQYPTTSGEFVEADDRDPLLGNMAFWVFSYWGGKGQPFASRDAHTPGDGTPWQDLLLPGWNLFSPPYSVTVPPCEEIIVVWRWDPAARAYRVVRPGSTMKPLEGYWVFRL